MLREIKEMLDKEQTEVFAVDEIHFSTEPCLIKWWFKKGEHFFLADTKAKTKLHDVWCIESENRIIPFGKAHQKVILIRL
jgi:hypothetical protein